MLLLQMATKRTNNEIFKSLFNGITSDDVLKLVGGNFIVADKVLPTQDCIDITNGAKAIKDMYVWQMLIKDMKHEANKIMYTKSKTTDDILAGKMVLWAIDIMEQKLENLSKLKWTK